MYAHSGKGNTQDTVKRVTIKITASERPRVLDFDSLIKSQQTAKPVSSPKPTTRSNNKSSNPKNSAGRVPTGSPAVRKPASETLPPTATRQLQTSSKTSTANAGAKAANAPSVKQNPKPSAKAPEGHTHQEEINQAQVVDEKTVIEPTDAKTSRTYLWVGFMLIVVGVILGILFGKTALLISIAGLVFVIIGYSI